MFFMLNASVWTIDARAIKAEKVKIDAANWREKSLHKAYKNSFLFSLFCKRFIFIKD